MKFVLAILAVMAIASQSNAYVLPSVGSGQLAKELEKFLDLLPVEDVTDVVKTYLARDKEFQLIISLMQSRDMQDYIDDVQAMPEFQQLSSYLYDNGLDSYALLKQLTESLEPRPVKVVHHSNCKITGSLAGFIKDFGEVSHIAEMVNLFEYEVLTSEVFRDFVHELLSPKYAQIFASSFENPNFKSLIRQLKALDVDSDEFQANFEFLLAVNTFIRFYL